MTPINYTPHIRGDLGQRLLSGSADADLGCRVWSRGRDSHGYGVIKVDGRPMRAYRAAWVEERGEIPAGALVDHICGNRLCINTSHLRLATRSENNGYRVSIPKNNTSGYLGVRRTRNGRRWVGCVKIAGVKYYTPVMDDPQMVSEALDEIRRKRSTVGVHADWVKNNTNDIQEKK